MHHCSEPPLSKTIVLARMGKEDVEGEGVGGEVYAKLGRGSGRSDLRFSRCAWFSSSRRFSARLVQDRLFAPLRMAWQAEADRRRTCRIPGNAPVLRIDRGTLVGAKMAVYAVGILTAGPWAQSRDMTGGARDACIRMPSGRNGELRFRMKSGSRFPCNFRVAIVAGLGECLVSGIGAALEIS